MTVTDELRQLLDEHGVEWWSDGDISSDHTEWATDSMAFTSLGMDGDKLAIKTITMMTPRQALDATLGRVIRDDTLRRESDARMALQRDYNNQVKRIQNQRKQLREMQEALERGKCHMVLRYDYEVYGEAPCIWLECDECGGVLPNSYGIAVSYCPNCGRKVQDERED